MLQGSQLRAGFRRYIWKVGLRPMLAMAEKSRSIVTIKSCVPFAVGVYTMKFEPSDQPAFRTGKRQALEQDLRTYV